MRFTEPGEEAIKGFPLAGSFSGSPGDVLNDPDAYGTGFSAVLYDLGDLRSLSDTAQVDQRGGYLTLLD